MKTRKQAKEDILFELYHGSGRVLLTGQGGVGKTHLVNELMKSEVIIPTATTGISAIMINGQTVHSFFKLGFASNINEMITNDRRFIHNNPRYENMDHYLSKFKSAIRNADIVMIDEVSMMGKELFDMVLYRLKQVNMNIPLLFVGDFLQLPPVNSDSILSHERFKDFKVVNLNKVYRTDDQHFLKNMNKIRIGEVDKEVGLFLKNLHPSVSIPKNPVRLFATNALVNSYNKEQLENIEGESVVVDPEVEQMKSYINQNQIEKFVSDCRLEYNFKLKVGARVMMTRNMQLDDDTNVVNGDIGTIIDFKTINEKIAGIVIDFDRIGTWTIERFLFEKAEYTEIDGEIQKNIIIAVTGFPIILAWAITIHKSQGSSIPSLAIQSDSIFAESQLYVALSRSSDPSNLSVDYTYSPEGLNYLLYHAKNVNQEAKHFYLNLDDSCQYE
jgi:hypothetical protein